MARVFGPTVFAGPTREQPVRRDSERRPERLTREVVAERLGISIALVRRFERRKKLHPKRTSHGYVFDPAEVDALAQERRVSAGPPAQTAMDGRLAAKVYAMLADGKSHREIVVALEIAPDLVKKLIDSYAVGGDIILSTEQVAELAKFGLGGRGHRPAADEIPKFVGSLVQYISRLHDRLNGVDNRDTATQPGDMSLIEELPNQLTSATPEQIATALVHAWRALWNESPSRKTLLVLLAQGAFETGWWKSCHCWNLGNAKSVEGDERSFTYFACSEIIGGKVVWFQPKHPATRFRAFHSLAEGATDYLMLLRNRFKAAWPALLAGDPIAFVHALKQQRYFTDDETHYAAQVSAIFRTLDQRFGSFDPAAVPDDPALTDEERERVMNLVALSLAELSRELDAATLDAAPSSSPAGSEA